MALRLCASCHRHVRTTEASCPFCATSASTLGRTTRAAVALGGGALFAVSLVACYGGPRAKLPDASARDASASDASARDALSSDLEGPTAKDGGR